MKRLYRQIYLTIIASLVLVVVVAGSIWRFGVVNPIADQALDLIGQVTAAALPPADAPADSQRAGLQHLSKRLGMDLSLFEPGGGLIAATGKALSPPRNRRRGGGWQRDGAGGRLHIRLPDERWLAARMPRPQRHPAVGLVLFLGSIALLVGLSAYPVVRRLTGRLERLQAGVETLGAGNLGARVKIEGKDEVARLAISFNQAAARIEALLGSHRQLLADASHELRTPLSRVRLGIEFLRDGADPKRMAALERDVAELDDLIEEILMASRLDTVEALETREDVDLLALVAEECARYEACELDGRPVSVDGDPRLLRRLVRNLLENARRHGKPPVIVHVAELGARVVIKVSDHGPGVPPDEHEAVFEPYYRRAGARPSAGFGLGLALVRQIARRHGGDASMAPSGNVGACVVVALPGRTSNKPDVKASN